MAKRKSGRRSKASQKSNWRLAFAVLAGLVLAQLIMNAEGNKRPVVSKALPKLSIERGEAEQGIMEEQENLHQHTWHQHAFHHAKRR